MLSRIDGMQRTSDENSNEQLAIAASISPRELEILQEISIGLSTREVAEIFSISPGAIKTHLENIFHNLDVNNRTQAIGRARALGWQR